MLPLHFSYGLTAGNKGNVTSRYVLLNGKGPLTANSTLLPAPVAEGSLLLIQPLSVGFIVDPFASRATCSDE